MAHLLTFSGSLAAGYVLAIYTWPAVRAFFTAAETRIAGFKAWLVALLDRVRDALGRGD